MKIWEGKIEWENVDITDLANVVFNGSFFASKISWKQLFFYCALQKPEAKTKDLFL